MVLNQKSLLPKDHHLFICTVFNYNAMTTCDPQQGLSLALLLTNVTFQRRRNLSADSAMLRYHDWFLSLCWKRIHVMFGTASTC